jgi:hypothetical protein
LWWWPTIVVVVVVADDVVVVVVEGAYGVGIRSGRRASGCPSHGIFTNGREYKKYIII